MPGLLFLTRTTGGFGGSDYCCRQPAGLGGRKQARSWAQWVGWHVVRLSGVLTQLRTSDCQVITFATLVSR